ncbi:hypothetical protein [Butyricimonas paravirosa]|jgi:hypothetical protein|uniref:hypothetical protein n=1 Tax=Butyricimonas paravirosa TaxID=1472417 RepID=UPI0022E3EAFA|nr:hypothetical protein [Butyricimonas paravirosa]
MRYFIAKEVDWEPYLIFDCIAMTDEELNSKIEEFHGFEIIPEREIESYRVCCGNISIYKLSNNKLILRNEKEFIKGKKNERKKELLDEIVRLKEKLNKTDWIVIKCTELCLTLANEYPEISAERAMLREIINKKELEIQSLN